MSPHSSVQPVLVMKDQLILLDCHPYPVLGEVAQNHDNLAHGHEDVQKIPTTDV